MKIILTRDESVFYDVLLRSIDPKVEKAFRSAVERDPLMKVEGDKGNGDVIYTVDEMLVLKIAQSVTSQMPVIAPLAKGLYAAVKVACTNLGNLVKSMYADAYKRHSEAHQAAAEIAQGERMIAEGQQRLCAATRPECAQRNDCCNPDKGCGEKASE